MHREPPRGVRGPRGHRTSDPRGCRERRDETLVISHYQAKLAEVKSRTVRLGRHETVAALEGCRPVLVRIVDEWCPRRDPALESWQPHMPDSGRRARCDESVVRRRRAYLAVD